MTKCQHCGEDSATHISSDIEYRKDYVTLCTLITLYKSVPNSTLIVESLERILRDWQVHALPECSSLSLA